LRESDLTKVASPPEVSALLRHIDLVEIPASGDLCSADVLAASIEELHEPRLSLIAVGDIMLAGRARRAIASFGPHYPFSAVMPLLRSAPIVAGNLEGLFARQSKKEPRHYSYRMKPELSESLLAAGINVLSLANNHLLDCGRSGVRETLDTLFQVGIAPLGAGFTERDAHRPAIKVAGTYRVGLLSYYWNRRCAATESLPGCALDRCADLSADLARLRTEADRIVVFFHWGIPYESDPSQEDREKARFAIDCGAHMVIGHHPHVVQPFEIYRGYPIFYSIGNFAFGSGNSRGEGLLLGCRFEESATTVDIYPLYVKNRDPRIAYQPKVLRGEGAARVLNKLARASGIFGSSLQMQDFRARLDLKWPPLSAADGPGIDG
jgi:capsule synthesis protein PGA_cap